MEMAKLPPAMVYYKGTYIPCPTEDAKAFYDNIKTGAKQMLVQNLREGRTIPELIDEMLSTLDEIENDMCVITKMKHFTNIQLIEAWGLEGYAERSATWCIFIEALIQVRALKNDTMNGWLFVTHD
jgi:hypothetical protein